MNATLPASLPSTGPLTLAKTGTVEGKPALIAYDGPKTTVLLVLTEDGSWSVRRSIPHSGIRGLGLARKELDAGSERAADAEPVFADATKGTATMAEIAAAPAAEIAVEKPAKAARAPKATLADRIRSAPWASLDEARIESLVGLVASSPENALAIIDAEIATHEACGNGIKADVIGSIRKQVAKTVKAPKAPAPEAKPAAPQVPAGPVADPALVEAVGADRALVIATTTDLALLRSEREAAIKAGAPQAAIRAITLRAGEIACGLSLSSLRKAAKPAPEAPATERAPRAPSTRSGNIQEILAKVVAETKPEANGSLILFSTRLQAAGIARTTTLTYSFWKGGEGFDAARALGYTSGLRSLGSEKAIVLTPVK